jgi:hypothetical protein
MSRNEKILAAVLALAAFGLAAWLTARWLPHRSAPAKPQSRPQLQTPPPPPAETLSVARVQELVSQAAVRKFGAVCREGRVIYPGRDSARLSADGRVWEVTGKFLWLEEKAWGGAYGPGASLVAEVDAKTGEVVKLSRRNTLFTTGAVAAKTYGLPVAEAADVKCVITHDLDTLEVTGAQEYRGSIYPPPPDKPAKAVAVPPGTKMKPAAPPAEVPPGGVEVF